MPGFNLQIESQKIAEFNAEQENETVTIDGTLVVTVNNGGLLPVYTRLTVLFGISEKVPILDSKEINGGLVVGKRDIKVPFEATIEEPGLSESIAIEEVCKNGTLSYAVVKSAVYGAVKISPGDVSENSSPNVENYSCDVNILSDGSSGRRDTGEENGNSVEGDPSSGEPNVVVDDMFTDGEGIFVEVSTSGVGQDETSAPDEANVVDVQLVDESVSGSEAIIANKTKSLSSGNFDSRLWEFRNDIEGPTTIRADVNMLEPYQLYTSERIEYN